MTRGVAHSPELRSEVVAAVIAGASISATARAHHLDKALVSRWVQAAMQPVASDQRVRDPVVDLGSMIVGLITEHIVTIQAQLQAAARPEWIEKQPAAELAALVAVERDTVLRLLAGLQPIDVDAPPALDAPRPPDSDP